MIRTKQGSTPDEVHVSFVLRPPLELDTDRSISVVGDFNGWNPGATPFDRLGDGTLEASATIPAGQRYAFRYLGEDNRWLNDPDTKSEPNGTGGENSVLDLTTTPVRAPEASGGEPS